MLQVGRVKSIGAKCRKPSHLCANISHFHPSHLSFQSGFDLLIPLFLKLFLCNHSTLSRNISSYFPPWPCITSHAFHIPLWEGALSHLFKILSYEIFFYFSLLGIPGQSIHLPPDELLSKWRKNPLDRLSCRRSPGATCMLPVWVCMPGRRAWIRTKATALGTVNLSFLGKHIFNTDLRNLWEILSRCLKWVLHRLRAAD